MLLRAIFKGEEGKRIVAVNWIQRLSDQRLMENRGWVVLYCWNLVVSRARLIVLQEINKPNVHSFPDAQNKNKNLFTFQSLVSGYITVLFYICGGGALVKKCILAF